MLQLPRNDGSIEETAFEAGFLEPAAGSLDGLARPLNDLAWIDRLLLRSIALLVRRDVVSISGMEHILPARDPFIFVANHVTRRESVHVPAMLALHRYGSLVHWFGDWNFRLIPGVDFLYRRAEIITVSRKPARPRVLTLLRPLFADPMGPLRRAYWHLREGRSVGLFPEGTVNRNPEALLAGHRGAAWLSLQTGASVVPAGILVDEDRRGHKQLSIAAAPPLTPPSTNRITRATLREWHATIMQEISRLSGKPWDPAAVTPRCSSV